MMSEQLTAEERRTLAREIAIDNYEQLPPYYTETTNRRAFRAGWDAAMKYNDEQRLSNSSSESN